MVGVEQCPSYKNVQVFGSKAFLFVDRQLFKTDYSIAPAAMYNSFLLSQARDLLYVAGYCIY